MATEECYNSIYVVHARSVPTHCIVITKATITPVAATIIAIMILTPLAGGSVVVSVFEFILVAKSVGRSVVRSVVTIYGFSA